MCAEVYKHQNIKTGGNLFGLWTTSGSAFVHVVLGPGKNCRRTESSFHQDLEYMHRVGRFVNDNYMLCHIGEWHSRHSLSLNRPSDRDQQTVRHNFPQGVTKFLVIIANIKNRDTILLSPYFFIDGGRRYEKAEFEVLDCDSPFSTDFKIMEQIDLGAECQRHKTALVERASHRGEPSRNTRNRQNTRSNPERSGNASSTCVQANQSSTSSIHDANSLIPQVDAAKPNSNQIISKPQADQSSSKCEDISSGPTRRHSVESIGKDESDLNPSKYENDTSSNSEITTPVSETTTSAGNQAEPDSKNDQSISNTLANQSPSESQDIPGGFTPDNSVEAMDADDTDPSASKDSNDTSSSFENIVSDTVSQPVSPARKQADLHSKDEQSISHYQVHPSLSKSQDSPSESTSGDSEEVMDIDDSDLILHDDDTDISSGSEISPSESETITPVGSPAEPDRNKNDDDDERPSEKEIVLKKIYDELKYWFGTKPQSNFNFKTSNCPGAIEIRFKHNYKHWMIRFPPDFPGTPAKLFHTSEDSVRFKECAQFDVVEPLNDEVNMLLTLKNICGACKICKKFTKESLSRPDFNLRNMDKLADFAHEFVIKLDKYFADFSGFKLNHFEDTSDATIGFEHNSQWWVINIPALFPDAPAKVYRKRYNESFQQNDVLLYENNQQGPQVLNTPQLVIKAINYNCFCSKCEKAHERRY